MEEIQNNVYHLFVRQLDGKTLALKFQSPILSYQTLISHLPSFQNLLLLSESRHLSPSTHLTANESHLFPTVTITARLLGGKGGFGSLLRGAATKAGQKKTNNFDACRDMSGRRLRHVNAEKRLEEWREEEEERKLEKMAEEFLKKKAKKGKENFKGESAEKYVEKYRVESEKCKAEVEKAVRESFGRKRKEDVKEGLDAKRLKIWLGKNKLEESDDDDMDEEDSSDDENRSEEENGRSTVINNGNREGLTNEGEGSPSSVSDGKFDGESSGGGSGESGAEDEKGEVVLGSSESGGSPSGCVNHGESNGVIEPEEVLVQTTAPEIEDRDANDSESADAEKVMGQIPSISTSEEENSGAGGAVHPEAKDDPDIKLGIEEAKATPSIIVQSEKQFTFDKYSSAAEMEVLGMERLKSELQARGLKCGGTLQERAARLFMLKSTPVDKLPKKLLAKK